MRTKTLTSRSIAVMVLCSLMVASLPLVDAYTPPSKPFMGLPVAGDGKVTLTWTAGSDGGSAILGYYIYRGTASGQETFYATVVGASATTYVDTGLTNNLTYYYYVAAVNDAGIGEASDEVFCTPMGQPGKPTGLTAVGGEGYVYLSWTAPYDNGGTSVTHYRVYRGTAAGMEIFLVNTTETSYLDTGLTLGRTYYYKVSAVTSFAEGPKSDEASALLSSVPGAITTLVAASGASSITLTWTAPSFTGGSAITGYQVYRSTASGQETFLANSLTTTFTDTSVVNGQAYYYRVSASNAAGTGALSNEVSSTPLSAPSAPQAPRASAGDHNVTITWSAPALNGGTAILYYRVYRGTSSGGEIFLTTTTSLEITDTGLTNGVTYYYMVSAVNDRGESIRSSEVSAVPIAVAGQPIGLAAVAGDGKVTLSWTAPSDTGGAAVVKYVLYWRTDPAGEYVRIDTMSAATSFVHDGLTNGLTYQYCVAAMTQVGEGLRSSTVQATPLAAPGAPGAVTAVGGAKQITLTWTAPQTGGADIVRYTIYRGLTSSSLSLYRTIDPATTFVDRTVLDNTTYYYRVAAENSEGLGALSSVVSAATFGLPGVPMDLSVVAGASQAALTWLAPSDNGGTAVTGYNVYRSTVSGAEELLTSILSTEFIDYGLTNGQTYYYRVSAVNSVGEGSWSSEVSATPASVPGKPTGLTATPALQQVTLAWTAPSDGGSAITGYNIYRSTTSGGQGWVPVAVGVALPFTDSGLAPLTTYYYKVTAVNAIGEGPRSDEVSCTTPAAPAAPAGLVAVPGNGTVDLAWTTVASSDGSDVTYQIYRSTTSGQERYLTTVDSANYTDAGLTNGVTYYYKVAAVNATGEGARSDEVSATPMNKPGMPTGLLAVASDSAVSLQWTAPAANAGGAVTGFRLYWSESPSGPFTAIEVVGTSYYHAGLVNGQPYYYKVAAVNSGGEGDATDVVSATPRDLPDAPLNLVAEGQDGKVLLTWSAPLDYESARILGYKVYRGNSSGTEVYYGASAETTFVDDDVVNGQTYYYRVTAINSTGESKMSVEASATPAAAPRDLFAMLSDVWLEIVIICAVLAAVIAAVFVMLKKGIISVRKGSK